ncbi:MAG: hypothetical protein C0596_13610 [Marinilabiliales bacterium]|nr:MAG: hypothetical protein C0596_13610 [Marinilabiliales bacterium]
MRQNINKIEKITESIWVKYFIFSIFIFIIAYLKFDHIFERDESQIVLIVNHNRNFFDLIKALGYEGTTGLWHVSLWILSCIFPITPDSVSIIHGIIIVTFIYLLIFRTDIPIIYKLIFLMLPNVLWNFIYVRQYILAMLFILLIINSIIKNKKIMPYVWITLLMQVHVTTIPVALSFLLFLVVSKFIKTKKIEFTPLIVPVIGFSLAVMQLLPPSDLAAGLKEWHFNTSLYGISVHFDKIIGDMLLMNDYTLQIISIPALISIILFFSFKKNRQITLLAILSLLISFCAFAFIRITKYLCPHHAYLLLYTLLGFVIILWKKTEQSFNKITYLFLIPVFIYSVYIYRVKIADYKYAPFSYAKELAIFLDENYSDKTVLIAPETLYNSVRVYRNNNSLVFSLGRNEYSNYTVWNHACVDHVLYTILPIKQENLTLDLNMVPDSIIDQEPLLIMGSEITNIFIDDEGNEIRKDVDLNDKIKLEFIRSFEGNTIKYITEEFIVFQIKRKKQSLTQ